MPQCEAVASGQRLASRTMGEIEVSILSGPDAACDEFVRLAGDAELRKRLGDNGRKAIEQHLGWQKMEQVLVGIHARLGKEIRP